MTAPVLEIRGVSKSFPGVKALDDVSFAINKGEVVGLIGENGAGKSTLLKVLNGIYHPDQGGIFVDGKPVDHIIRRARRSIPALPWCFRNSRYLPTLTVAENIFLGREEEFLRFGLISKKPHECRGGQGTCQGPSRHQSRHTLRRSDFRRPPDGRNRQGSVTRHAASRVMSPSCSMSRRRCWKRRKPSCCSRSSVI